MGFPTIEVGEGRYARVKLTTGANVLTKSRACSSTSWTRIPFATTVRRLSFTAVSRSYS